MLVCWCVGILVCLCLRLCLCLCVSVCLFWQYPFGAGLKKSNWEPSIRLTQACMWVQFKMMLTNSLCFVGLQMLEVQSLTPGLDSMANLKFACVVSSNCTDALRSGLRFNRAIAGWVMDQMDDQVDGDEAFRRGLTRCCGKSSAVGGHSPEWGFIGICRRLTDSWAGDPALPWIHVFTLSRLVPARPRLPSGAQTSAGNWWKRANSHYPAPSKGGPFVPAVFLCQMGLLGRARARRW